LFPALLLSCIGVPDSRFGTTGIQPPLDLVHVSKLSAQDTESFAQEGLNPYTPRISLLFRNNRPVFYTYKLVLPPSSSFRIKLVSATLSDKSGNEQATLLTSDELRRYWSRYPMPDEDAQLLQSIIDRTYFGRTDFNYSSRKAKSFVLVFTGNEPGSEDVIAKFKFQVNGEEIDLEVK